MEELGLRHFAARDRDAPAIVDPRGRTWTRGELLDLVERTSHALAGAGLEQGDVVAIVAPNCAEFLASYLAGIDAGLYIVPVNWHLAAPEIDYLLESSGAKAIIAHERLGSRLATLRAHGGRMNAMVAIGGAEGFESLSDFGNSRRARPVAGRQPGRLLPYTSATTGSPKAVRRPLSGSRDATRKTVAWHRSLGIELERANVHLCCSMLYHAAPLEGALIALEMGHAVALLDAWDPEVMLETIETRRVTTTFVVPTMFVRLLKLPRALRERYSIATLRFVVHGGAPCPIETKRRMIEWWGPVIWEAYGATEAQGVIASTQEWLRYPGTVGRAAEGAQIRILSEGGVELRPGEVGLVYLKSHTGESFEYVGDEEKTRAGRRGELVTAGDLGYLNDAGYLFVCGRRTEVIISSGQNVYPAEIEQALIGHPAVADCAVVGVPDELFGEAPHAFVQLVVGCTPCADLTRALLLYLGARVAPMKLPRRIHYSAALPRDPTGKLRRDRLVTEPRGVAAIPVEHGHER